MMHFHVSTEVALWLLVLLLQQQLARAYATYSSSFIYTPPQRKAIAPQQSRRPTLVIYDPKSGRQLEPLAFLPILSGNKRRPTQPQGNLVSLPQLWNPCSCSEFACMCCLGLRFGEVLNQRVCVGLQYDAIKFALQLRINVNKRNIISFDFSARNPPAYCVPVLLPFPVFACLRLYDIRAQGGNVQVCISLVLNVLMNQLFEYHFDCVRFGSGGVQFIKSEAEPMVYGAVEAYEQDEDDYRQSIRLEEDYSGISVEPEGQGFIRMGRVRG